MKMIGTLLLVLAVLMLSTAVVLAWAIGFGWLLIRFLPFTWFETSLLTLIGSISIIYSAWQILQAGPPDAEPETLEFNPSMPIPWQRFQHDDDDQSNEISFRYEIANNIFWELEDVSEIIHLMDGMAMKELAIRLTDLVVGVLKKRKGRARQVKITLSQLKRQMDKIGQRPYSDDILQAAVGAVNIRLASDDELADIVREKSWDEIDPDW